MTYAQVAATVARKEGRHQTALAEAQKRGDRAAINSATRMLDRIAQYKDEVYADQEAQKMPVAQQSFANGGGTPFRNAGNPPYANANPYVQPGFSPFKADPTYIIPALAGHNIDKLAIKSGTVMHPSVPVMPKLNIPESAIKGATTSSVASGATAKTGGGMDWTKAAQYAQMAPELLGMLNVGRMKAPAKAPQLDPTLINTTVDTQAQQAALNSSNQRYNQSVNSGVASAPVAQALKLAGKLGSDTQMGQLLETKGNQERALRSEQSRLLTDTRNRNRMIDTDNQNAQNQFVNEKIGLQQGLINSAGNKVAAIGQENAQRKLDKDSLALYSKMFDTGLLARNKFGDTIEELDPIVKAALDKDPALKAQYEAYLKKQPGSIGAPRSKDAFQKDLNLMTTQSRLQAGVFGRKR